jgi:hypothetical protein
MARRGGRPELCLLERLAAGPEERCSLRSRPTKIRTKVKELLGHRPVTTTQIYDKRRRSLKEGASHDVPI